MRSSSGAEASLPKPQVRGNLGQIHSSRAPFTHCHPDRSGGTLRFLLGYSIAETALKMPAGQRPAAAHSIA